MKIFPHPLKSLVLTALVLAATAGNASAVVIKSSEIYQKTMNAAVWIRSAEGTGTGWVIDKEARLVITNHHVVGNNASVQVHFPVKKSGKIVAEKNYYINKDKPFFGKVIDSDPKCDLAVVQLTVLPPGTAELKLAPEGVGPGDRLHSIGNPSISEALWVYSYGTVRQIYEKAITYKSGQQVNCRMIETQSPINPGDSGGPVLNGKGELVGIVAASRFDATMFSYCIELDELKGYFPLVRKLLNPKSAADFERRGTHYANRGRADLAVADLSQALKLDPKLDGALSQRGEVLFHLGDFENAVTDFDKAIALNDRKARTFLARGMTQLHLGDREKAAEDFDSAIKLDPKGSLALFQRGKLRHREGEHDKAIQDFTAALKLEPKNLILLRARATAYISNGDPDKAIADLTEVIKALPKDGEAYLMRTRAFARKGDYARAQADMAAAAKLGAKFLK
jgi:tetratricopeptide (TPR) repeat protein